MNQIGDPALYGIGGSQPSIGSEIIAIAFKELGLIIDVDFSIMPSNIPTPLSMRDMSDKGIDISMHVKTISCQGRKQNHFLWDSVSCLQTVS